MLAESRRSPGEPAKPGRDDRRQIGRGGQGGDFQRVRHGATMRQRVKRGLRRRLLLRGGRRPCLWRHLVSAAAGRPRVDPRRDFLRRRTDWRARAQAGGCETARRRNDVTFDPADPRPAPPVLCFVSHCVQESIRRRGGQSPTPELVDAQRRKMPNGATSQNSGPVGLALYSNGLSRRSYFKQVRPVCMETYC